jgi:hypothetical protein
MRLMEAVKPGVLLLSHSGGGRCELCTRETPKLERHHIRYRPEITIKLCHSCHFRIHFNIYQLTESEIYQLLCRVYSIETLQKFKHSLKSLLSLYLQNINGGVKSDSLNLEVAPSRTAYLKSI